MQTNFPSILTLTASGSMAKSERQKKIALPLDCGEGERVDFGHGRPPEGPERLVFDWIAACGEAQRRDSGAQDDAIDCDQDVPPTPAHARRARPASGGTFRTPLQRRVQRIRSARRRPACYGEAI